jgi:hypothetical protein
VISIEDAKEPRGIVGEILAGRAAVKAKVHAYGLRWPLFTVGYLRGGLESGVLRFPGFGCYWIRICAIWYT